MISRKQTSESGNSLEQISSVKETPGLVHFENVKEKYRIDEDIILYFTQDSKVQSSSQDWVGLFPRGWHSLQQYVAFEWVITHSSKEAGSRHKIIFRNKQLHSAGVHVKEYHFLYINKHCEIQGVSNYFRFIAKTMSHVSSGKHSTFTTNAVDHQDTRSGNAEAETNLDGTNHDCLNNKNVCGRALSSHIIGLPLEISEHTSKRGLDKLLLPSKSTGNLQVLRYSRTGRRPLTSNTNPEVGNGSLQNSGKSSIEALIAPYKLRHSTSDNSINANLSVSKPYFSASQNTGSRVVSTQLRQCCRRAINEVIQRENELKLLRVKLMELQQANSDKRILIDQLAKYIESQALLQSDEDRSPLKKSRNKVQTIEQKIKSFVEENIFTSSMKKASADIQESKHSLGSKKLLEILNIKNNTTACQRFLSDLMYTLGQRGYKKIVDHKGQEIALGLLKGGNLLELHGQDKLSPQTATCASQPQKVVRASTQERFLKAIIGSQEQTIQNLLWELQEVKALCNQCCDKNEKKMSTARNPNNEVSYTDSSISKPINPSFSSRLKEQNDPDTHWKPDTNLTTFNEKLLHDDNLTPTSESITMKNELQELSRILGTTDFDKDKGILRTKYLQNQVPNLSALNDQTEKLINEISTISIHLDPLQNREQSSKRLHLQGMELSSSYLG